jgi:hypothetical protein
MQKITRGNSTESQNSTAYTALKYERKRDNVGGSGEPMCEYNPHVMDEADNGDLHDMPRVRQRGRTGCRLAAYKRHVPSLSPPQTANGLVCVRDPRSQNT